MAIDATKTLRRLIYEFNEWADDHKYLQKFGYGQYLKTYEEEGQTYPVMVVNCTSSTIDQWYVNYNLEVIVLEWVYDDEDNKQTANSDTLAVFKDLDDTIRWSDRWQEFSRLDADITAEKIDEFGGDKAYGWLATFQLKVKKKSGICDLTALMPEYDFDMQGTSDSLEVIVEFQGTATTTNVQPGETVDFQVVDDADSPVGSLITDTAAIKKVQVSTGGDPATNSMNGTELTDIPAGGDKDFTIQDSDTNPVTVTTISDSASAFVGEVTPAGSVYYDLPQPVYQVSYNTYDEGWQYINNTWDQTIPSNGIIQQVDPDDFYKVVHDKEGHGHLYRFMGINDGYYNSDDGLYYDSDDVASTRTAVFDSPNFYTFDRLTGLGIRNTRESAATFTTHLTNANASTDNGFSDWFLPFFSQMVKLIDPSLTNPLYNAHSPVFNMQLSKKLSSPYAGSPTTAGWYVVGPRADVRNFRAYTSTDVAFFVRKGF